jgi:hypothetical protein
MPLRFLFFASFCLLANLTMAQSTEDCPTTQTFGDSSAASFLEFADEGYVTRIYFAELAAQQTDSAAYQLLLPRFGANARNLSEMNFVLSYDDFWERWELSLPRRRVNRIECARYPDALREFSGGVPDSLSVGEDQIFVEHMRGSREEGSYFHLRLLIGQLVPMPDPEATVEGEYVPDSAQEARPVDFAEATYDPSEQTLRLSYGTIESYQSVSLDGVSPGPGRYEEVNDYYGRYTHKAYVIDTLQPELLALRVYDFSALKQQGEASDAGFFPDVEIEYPLSAGKLVADLRSTDLTWQPEVPALVFGQEQARPSPARPQQPSSAADFDGRDLPAYLPISPFDLTYFPTKAGDQGPVGIQEHMQTTEEGNWQLTLSPVERQASSGPDDPRLQELEGIMGVFKELEALRGPDAYDQALPKIKQLNQRYELGMSQDFPEEMSPLREKLVEAVMAKYPKDLIQQAYGGGEGKGEGNQLDEMLPIALTMDSETGLPLRTYLDRKSVV